MSDGKENFIAKVQSKNNIEELPTVIILTFSEEVTKRKRTISTVTKNKIAISIS